MPTLAQLQRILGRYAGANNSFADRLNEVVARILPEGNWKNTKEPVRFVVYEDRDGNSVVTLGPDHETILAGTYQAPSSPLESDNPSRCYGRPLPVQNGWYETAMSGPGSGIGSDARRGIIRLEGRYTTFADWSEPRKLRIKLEVDESPGAKIIIRGKLDGAKIFTDSANGNDFIEGVEMNFVNATVTTTEYFDEPPYAVIKPVTKGRIALYIVDDSNNETLVAWYEPNETTPSYSRFKVPACPHS